MNLKKYLVSTPILNYETPVIQSLIESHQWKNLSDYDKIKQIYTFVRDEIKFGYNIDDNISASEILKDGYGQCNTKANLFMTLLRAVGIPNRMHGFTINKALQKGAISGLWYWLSPQEILHSWVEVYFEGQWYNLEGIILDKPYLKALQAKFKECTTTFCGYGAYTNRFDNPPIDWDKNNTYIQDKGINQDFGLFDSPDDFYRQHQQKLNPVKKWFYRNFIRFRMNRNVDRIRESLKN